MPGKEQLPNVDIGTTLSNVPSKAFKMSVVVGGSLMLADSLRVNPLKSRRQALKSVFEFVVGFTVVSTAADKI